MRITEAWSTPALRAPRNAPVHRELPEDSKRVSKEDAEPTGTGIRTAKPPARIGPPRIGDLCAAIAR
jgi:hypothetical protein